MKKIVMFLMLGLMFATIIVHATTTNTIGNKNSITRDVTVAESTGTLTLTTLSLESNATTLNKGEKAQLSVVATYSDHSTKAVDANVTYIITPTQNAEVNGTTLTALKDGSVTVQAKVGTVLSNAIDLNIIWVVNGHTLPPEPDKTANDATLLGIDVNHNGVRDDVERYIYKTYKQPIERGIMLQNANRLQTQISDIGKAHEYAKLSNKSLSCEYYLEENYKWFSAKYEYMITSKEIKKIQFNNIKRHIEYERYNAQFNGEVFDGQIVANKENCLFDEQGNLRDIK